MAKYIGHQRLIKAYTNAGYNISPGATFSNTRCVDTLIGAREVSYA
jgi:hypothetical protein